MELNLINEKLKYTKCIRTGVITTTETVEMIVPDSMPDITDISQTSCDCFLKGKDAGSGYIRISALAVGAVTINAEYRCRRLDINIPLTMNYENADISPESKICAEVNIRSAEARIINPRKISVTVTAEASAYILSESETDYPSFSDSSDIPSKSLTQKVAFGAVIASGERQYVISDELRIADDRKPIDEILFSETMIITDDVKTVGSKAIINCTAKTSIVYSSADDGSVDTVHNDTRYTQIVELEENTDDAEVVAVSALTGVYMNSDLLASSDERRLSMELHIVTQCMAIRKTETEILSDIYSPVYMLDVAYDDKTFESVTILPDVNDSFRIPVKCDGVSDILASSAEIIEALYDGVYIRLRGKVRVLYSAFDGSLLSAESGFEHKTELNSDHACDCISVFPFVSVSAVSSSEGADADVNVRFELLGFEKITKRCVKSIVFDEDRKIDPREHPSFVIRVPRDDDDIWSISKDYLSDADAIYAANGVSDEKELFAKPYILIPKCR